MKFPGITEVKLKCRHDGYGRINSLRTIGLKQYKFSTNTAIEIIIIQNSADFKTISRYFCAVFRLIKFSNFYSLLKNSFTLRST